ncbi:hypothetical protein [Henriciella sp.]|uniref:hypothetical protein n=1 Tax=Henriciella sp. TaxID=1968823 RepID=UPI002621558E|nr:hypothetical protein [Henriciella sp.]
MKRHGEISIRQWCDGKWRRTFHTGPGGPDGLAYDLHSPGFEIREGAETYRFQGEVAKRREPVEAG